MTVIVGIGASLGLGLWALTVWLVPPRPALRTAIARGTTMPTPDTPAKRRVIGSAVAVLRSAGLPSPKLTRDLTVLGRGVDDHLAKKLALAMVGLAAPILAVTAAAVLGIAVGLHVPAALALACATGGFLLPDVRVRQAARQRRADFRHALSAYIDLVVISLAGGAGVDSALNDSVAVGHGWAFTQLQRALAAARFTRDTPWTALRRLGDELTIPELPEVAASLSLAGTEGARVRQSLSAKATSLRTRQLNDAESRAASATERMSLPIVLLFLGFLIFIAYPAAHQVLNGL
ncbi:type II secretion system F family protein [Actinophytocola oryzae]|uniref:Type II secretion system (T2SS) protein F n=1 Tax=Actinophytocola oryzae TaxID=502181 RepID=A0A4R7V652_9PSEU|nr:type II secretion system F family protein [Actinophytocola oryzae]TDV44167.1 type II secretion system (T2SS) protein F [Actinophytocola oryzae]